MKNVRNQVRFRAFVSGISSLAGKAKKMLARLWREDLRKTKLKTPDGVGGGFLKSPAGAKAMGTAAALFAVGTLIVSAQHHSGSGSGSIDCTLHYNDNGDPNGGNNETRQWSCSSSQPNCCVEFDFAEDENGNTRYKRIHYHCCSESCSDGGGECTKKGEIVTHFR